MTDCLPPIIYVSNAGWDYGLPTNRQQLPKRLAAHTKVLYSSPFSLSQAALGKIPVRRFAFGVQEIEPNLYLARNVQFLPLVRAQIWPLRALDRWLTTSQLKHYAAVLGFQRPILWLYYPPSYQHLIGQFGEALTCYHCTDDHAGYAAALGLDPQGVAVAEERLVRAVDAVFTTSRPLFDQKFRLNPRTYLMPNVADTGRFRAVAEGSIPAARELQVLPHPIAGFVGAVDDYKVNLELITQTARLLPGWSFVFIGPVGLGDRTRPDQLPRLPNIHFLGPRPYDALPAYMAGFDVGIIPYHLNSYTTGVFPLKFWEYLASGKPVVTTSLPGLQDYREHVEMADGPAAFAAALQRAFVTASNGPAVRRRVELAAGHSWEARAEEILHVLRGLL